MTVAAGVTDDVFRTLYGELQVFHNSDEERIVRFAPTTGCHRKEPYWTYVIERNAHVNGRDHYDGADFPDQATSYDAMIASAPHDAVEAAWRDVENVTRGAFAGKTSFADPGAPVPAGVMGLLLRTQANVDQEHAAHFQQLSEVHQLIANGETCDQPVARKFCVEALQLIAYLGKK